MAGRSRESLYAVEFANAPVVLKAQIVEAVTQCSRGRAAGGGAAKGARRGMRMYGAGPAMKVAGVLMQILRDSRDASWATLPSNTKTVWAERASVGVRGLPVAAEQQSSRAAESVRRCSRGRRVAGVSGVVKHPCAGIEGSGGRSGDQNVARPSLIALCALLTSALGRALRRLHVPAPRCTGAIML